MMPQQASCSLRKKSLKEATSWGQSGYMVKSVQKPIQTLVTNICIILFFSCLHIIVCLLLLSLQKSYCLRNMDTATPSLFQRQRNLAPASCHPAVKNTEHKVTFQCKALISISRSLFSNSVQNIYILETSDYTIIARKENTHFPFPHLVLRSGVS